MKINTAPLLNYTFERAVLDRNMTTNVDPVRDALAAIDMNGTALIDFGCGNGNLLRLLKDTKADTVYAFEVMPEHIDADIMEWANDPSASPRLVLNPPEYKIDPDKADGDLTNYDFFALLSQHEKFGIVSNPPYFLYQRILSLTGENLAKGSERFSLLRDKFQGALMITSKSRLHNHPGWEVKAVMDMHDFHPPAGNDQYLLQKGFGAATEGKNVINSLNPPQKYVSINNRNAKADMTDHYPDMWAQLDSLTPA